METRGQVRVGTSGWVYRHWRGTFYPNDLPTSKWLAHYASRFDTVEVNNTFYRLPAARVFTGWGQQVPEGFTFAVKASRYLTHPKRLRDVAEPLERLLERARRLGPHLGPILYQLPPHWRCDPERLRNFVAGLPRDLRHVLEVRDPSWYTDEVRDILTAGGVALCIHDLRSSAAPHLVTAPFVFLRFHGPTRVPYRGRYGPEGLRAWADFIHGLRASGRDVYAYFNNDQAGHALADAEALRGLLDAG